MINQDTFSILKNNAHLLKNNLHGIEREALRVDSDGVIAQTPHPKPLGSALTHPYITTDYSEALLEFVTPTFHSIDECLTFMRQIHQFTMDNMHDKELLWMSSMPCITPNNDCVPIAKYGSSNVAKMKEIYRRGLGIRYGRPMQTISGIHYNFSFSDELMTLISGQQKQSISDSYLGLTRNFRRHAWSLIYFLGASPALCKSFICEKQREDLSVHKDTTLFLPYATSLRMSDLGYQNDAQSLLPISLNSLDEYINSLQSATATNYPPYEEMGLKNGDEYHQLSTKFYKLKMNITPLSALNSQLSPVKNLLLQLLNVVLLMLKFVA
jgi:glutamate-cysteine ligase (EC 6.3.2.2)